MSKSQRSKREDSLKRRCRVVSIVAIASAIATLGGGRAAADHAVATTPAPNVVGLGGGQSHPANENEGSTRTSTGGDPVSVGAGDQLPLGPVQMAPGGGLCTTGPGNLSGWGLMGVATIPSCPAGPAGAGAPAPPPPTPLEAAYQAWYTEVVLPDPTLATNPTRAITGLDTFLTIGGPQTVTWAGTALGHQVRLDVASTYDIDWDDPRPDSQPNGRARITGTTSQGGPYPHGDLRHQYIDRGPVTIQVTQRWTAHWSAGGQSGTLADRLLTTSSLVLPVEELQAVVTG